MVQRNQFPVDGTPSLAETAPADSCRSESEAVHSWVVSWVHPLPCVSTRCTEAPQVLGREGPSRLSGSQVSRRHAEIRALGDELLLIDLASRNGTYVNGQRVHKALLSTGDVLRLGDCVGVVERTNCPEQIGFADLGFGIFGGVALRQVIEQAKLVAATRLSVLLVGETGTGKERLAQFIHAASGRSGALLAVNCAVYGESTIAAELFGFRRGAFTGAEQSSPGHVRSADRGTLFLDEVLELPLAFQPKLLRSVEQQEVLPLGETRPVSVDVRYISAAQVTLAEAVQQGRFRADLRARLEGLVLRLPPLRARRADIVPLFRVMLMRYTKGSAPTLTPRLLEQLSLHDWPMNVRELDNVAGRLLALFGNESRLTAEHAAPLLAADTVDLGSSGTVPSGSSTAPPASRTEYAGGEVSVSRRGSAPPYPIETLQALAAALARHQGNVTRAAEELGVTRPKAYRMLRAMESKE
jgi:transcriptional regulator with PAS, ATPase and Fis domain